VPLAHELELKSSCNGHGAVPAVRGFAATGATGRAYRYGTADAAQRTFGGTAFGGAVLSSCFAY